MRLVGLRLRGLTTAFPGEVSIDLASLPRVVAVVGENGAGKTTLLEAMLAALYRKLQSRGGSLYDYVPTDAFVEASFVDQSGAAVVARLNVDAAKKKTEQHLLVDGRPVTTGREAEVAAEVRHRFGSLDLVGASVFQSQGREGDLVGRARADRKALFAEMLDLGRYSQMALAAGKRREDLERRLAETQGQAVRLSEQEAELVTIDATMPTEKALELELAQGVEDHDRVIEAKRENLEDAQAAAATGQTFRAAAVEAQRGAEHATKVVHAAKARVEAAKASFDRAVNRRRDFDRTQESGIARALEALETATAEAQALNTGQGELETSAQAAQAAALTLWTELQEATAALEAVRVAKANLAQAEALIAAERKTLEGSAALLGRVPCTSTADWLDVNLAADESIPVDLAGACPLLAAARAAKGRLVGLDVDPELCSAYQEALDVGDLHRQPKEIETALDQARTASEASRGKRDAALQALTTAKRNRTKADEELRRLRAEGERSGAMLKREKETVAAEVAEASRKLEEADAQAAEALARAGAAHAAAQPFADDLSTTRVAQYRLEIAEAVSKRSEAQKFLEQRRSYLAKMEGRREQIELALVDLRASALEARGMGDDLSDWRVIESALGRDGIQTFEVDAAGPAVAAIVNDLLACWSARFALKFETLRAKKGDSGYTEVFDILVYDNEGNAWRKVEDLCGGEKVFVKEALSLGIAVYNARRSGQGWRTFFRDEADGALSEHNAVAYLAMLRRALELGGFEQVLFITHRPSLWERADARLHVHDGRVDVAESSEIHVAAAVA